MYFSCTNLSIMRKNHVNNIFAVIKIFLFSLGLAADKKCVSHANKIGIYILYFVLLENY